MSKAAKKAKKGPKMPDAKRMSTRQYLLALKELGLTTAGKRTAASLGLGLRQCQRMAAGDVPVPPPVELLLKMYIKHGLPDDA